MKLHFLATTQSGSPLRGTREASSEDDLRRTLSAEGLILRWAKPEKAPLSQRFSAVTSGGISALDKVMFVRHLALMLSSGLPIVESLQSISEQTSSRSLQRVTRDLLESIQNGNSFAKSLARHRRVFSELFINIVKIGESSGTLEKNLSYLAVQLEKDFELRRRVRSAMLYPLIIFIATLALGGALSVFVMPKLVTLFSGLDIDLPATTRAFLALAGFLANWGVWVVVGIAALIVLIRIGMKTRPVRRAVNAISFALPFSRNMVIAVNLARITRTLGILLSSGLPVTESLHITGATVNNILYQDILRKVSMDMERGVPIGKSLASYEGQVPKMVSRMISVGEKTGKLDETLGYLAAFYESEVETVTKNLSTVIEPILLIIIGLVVGGLGIAIITPIYQLSGSLGQ